MNTETATKIITRTWTGRNGVVRHYINNLSEVVGYDAPRSASAWINPDGTWSKQGFNNGDWSRRIDAAVKAHNEAGAPVEAVAIEARKPAGAFAQFGGYAGFKAAWEAGDL